MTLPVEFAHRRYSQQAGWTAQLRRHIFTRAGLPNAKRILELGSGTGAILSSLSGSKASVFGLDIELESLQFSKTIAEGAILTNGDASRLPFPNGKFDISFFHYVLLWLKDPVVALSEARRVTRPGGAVIAFAEPDYSLRKTPSPELTTVNEWQIKSLQAQGANPAIGSRLSELFTAAGIQTMEFSQIAPMPTSLTGQDLELELEVLKADLKGFSSPSEVDAFATSLHETKNLVTFQVPTYFCWGRVSIS